MKKLKITADHNQLKRIGISRNISNMEVTFLKDYPDGYIEIEIPIETDLKRLDLGLEPERYDIPKYYTESI